MKIQTRPWAIASTIGILVEVVLNFGLSSLMGLVLPRLMADAQMSDSTELAMLSMGIGAAQLCLCGSVFGLLVGALYALALPRDEYFTATESALGGSLSAAAASVAAGVLGLFISLMFLIAQIGPQMGETVELAGLVFTKLFTGIGGVVVGGIVALIMGAVGGGVALAVMRRAK